MIDPTPFNRTRNNGIVKSNLFQGWPKSHLAQVDYSNIEPGFDVCDNYWRLRKADVLKGLVGRAPDASLFFNRGTPVTVAIPARKNGYEDRPSIERSFSFLSVQLRTLIGESILRLPTVLSSPMMQWISSFKPDLIYSILALGPIMRLSVKVSRRWDIPIVPYFTDDWISTIYKDNILGPVLRRNMHHWLNECFKRAPICLTPNDTMNAEYGKRFGGRFEALTYAVETIEAEENIKERASRDVKRLVFIGSLEPNRWRPLKQIGEALLDLRLMNVNAELLIYTFPAEIKKYHKELTPHPGMRIAGTAAPIEVSNLQRDADILVHVESFDDNTRAYTKYSLSTKIPQYMMAGNCIFAYGPREGASMKYLSDSGAGVVVGEEDFRQLRLKLSQLIGDSNLRLVLGKRARDVALQRHEGKQQRDKFRSILANVCANWARASRF